MPGGNYGYHPRGPGQTHWHEEQPGVVPKILRTGFGSPTGMCVYEGTLLPLSTPRKQVGFTTKLLHTDAGPREVRCYHLKPDGAGYQVEKQVLVSSTDTWFRPSDICVAPDGSAFVADWYDPGVGGHGMGDLTRGRIYRLAPKGNKPSVPNTDVSSNAGILAALGNPALSVQALSKAKLRSMKSSEALDLVKPLIFGAADPLLKARASWIAPQILPLRDWIEITGSLFRHGDDRLRCQAVRMWDLFTPANPNLGPYQEMFTNDQSVRVRRDFLLLLRRLMPETVVESFYQLGEGFDGKDRFYLCALGIAVGRDERRREVILDDFDRHYPKWNDKVADLVWELRPPSVMAKLPGMLSDKSLTVALRVRMVDVLAGTPDTSGGQALLKALTPDMPPEVRDRILANLRQFLPGKWRALRQSKETGEAIDRLMANPEHRLLALALVGAAAKEDAIGRVVQISRDDKEPMAVRSAAIHALGAMALPAATKALEDLFTVRPVELRVHVPQALGEQLDIYASGDKPAMKALHRLVQAKDQDQSVRLAAVTALIGTYHGTGWLLDAIGRKELPDDLKSDTGRLLRNSPFGDHRQRALAAFPSPKLDPKKLPDIAKLAKRRGNAEHGKQFLAATVKNDLQCMKCHTIHGQGGQVGPDLSMIGKKASRENLFESILYPSKAIADQYVTWNIVTKDGKSVSGLLIEETGEHVLIRDANGKDTKIAKKDIDAREKDPKSLMPENLLAYMTEDELVDMVEYLLTLKEEKK
jgi:putative heme-binding domain-containing protein